MATQPGELTLSQLTKFFEIAALVEGTTRAKCVVATRKWIGLMDDGPAGAVDLPRIGQWQLRMKEAGMSIASIRSYFGSMSQVFSWGVEQKLLAANPWLLAKRIRPLKRAVVTFSDAEIEDLAKAAAAVEIQDPSARLRWTAILLLAGRSGLRAGEIENLRWEDIDLEARAVRIRWRPDRWGEYWTWGTKGRTDRVAPLGQAALECFYRLAEVAAWRYPILPRQTCERLQGLVGAIPERIRKRPYQHVYGQFRKIRLRANAGRECRKAGPVKNGCLHTMRKTAISRWAADGVPMADAKYCAGHQSSQTTETYYVAVAEAASISRVRESIDRE